MAKKITIRQVMRDFNIAPQTIVEFLQTKGVEIGKASPRTPISPEAYELLLQEFELDKSVKEKSASIREEQEKEKRIIRQEKEEAYAQKRKEEEISGKVKLAGPKIVGKVDSIADDKPVQKEEPKNTPVLEEPPVVEESPVVEETPVVKDVPKVKKVEKEEPVKQEKPESKPVQKEVEAKKNEEKELKPKKSQPVLDKKKTEDKKPEKVVEAKEDKKIKAVVKEEKKAGEKKAEEKIPEEQKPEEIKTQYQKLKGVTTTGQTIDLKQFEKKPKKKEASKKDDTTKKKKRKRIHKTNGNNNRPQRKGGGNRNYKKPVEKKEVTKEDIERQYKETLERLQGQSKSKRSKIKREGRQKRKEQAIADRAKLDEESKTLKITEFITVSELASVMDVAVTEVITACFGLGLMVTMNQRLDAETISIVTDEFGYDVNFIDAEEDTEDVEIEDAEEDLTKRPPVVTIMGHVDHGKTSLLDYIRNANVVAGESGGITQHIGAYKVELENGEKLSFIDTPGHEAFTAMRARGAKVTDVVVIVIAADDDIMPQTKEAISHAQAGAVPMIFAINKVDKPNANPDNVKQQLANMNLLVEDWGGKYQSQEVSAKTGQGVTELLEKIVLESEMLDLKANPNRDAVGTVLEAALDKGRGYVADILVQNGSLKVGDYILAGKYHGKVKAMYDERDKKVKIAGPSTPIRILGLNGAPTAGDRFKVFAEEREAKKIAQKRDQIIREQQLRTQKHITLDEIGRRIALGDFKELNLIIKGDVDGSVEALSDSLQKLSTENISVNIIHKAVGQITDSDVLLASASDAIMVGFNVRPSVTARRLAEEEQVQIKTYSIIYDVINDVKEAMEGMLSPEIKEEITGTAEVRNIFKVSKVGVIAGCMVTTGKIFNQSKIRLIREGIVIHDGELSSLKRFKDDVKDVAKGYECGLTIKNNNNIEEGDVIEAYKNFEVKRKL